MHDAAAIPLYKQKTYTTAAKTLDAVRDSSGNRRRSEVTPFFQV
jgi:hypothetical protein